MGCTACDRLNRVPAARISQPAHCAACKAYLLPLGKPIPVRSAADFEELIADSPVPVLVDFWAAWCPPCRAVAPELEKLAHDRAGRVIVAKVDTEELPDVAGRFAIRSIPTLVVMRGGREARRVSGAMPAEAIASSLAI